MTKCEKRQLAELMAKARIEYLDVLCSSESACDLGKLFIISETLDHVGEVLGYDDDYYCELISVHPLYA